MILLWLPFTKKGNVFVSTIYIIFPILLKKNIYIILCWFQPSNIASKQKIKNSPQEKKQKIKPTLVSFTIYLISYI
jgi:hypothetical protein